MHSVEGLTIWTPVSPKLQKAAVAMIALPVAALVINASLALQPIQAISQPTSHELKLIELTNQERIARGLKPLKYNPELRNAAQAKAADILNKDYFDHVSPQGKTPWQFIDQSGYSYRKAGENLAIDFTTVEGPVAGWMNSPSHRANVLKADYEEVGIAEVTGDFNGRETTVVVQMFGTQTFSLSSLLK